MPGYLNASAAALALLACPCAALAADDIAASDAIVSTAPLASDHGPAGMMGDHVHEGGEIMIGLTWTHEDFRGANLSGSDRISDAELVAAGYGARTRSMTMDMAMLHLMWAPSDRVTLVAMPMWMRMEMTMVGIAAPAMSHAMSGHHMLMPGETMTHAVSGLGDTEVGALVSLSRAPGHSLHAGLLVSVPTGAVDRRNADGTYVHYGMQPGSGTWDLLPSLTLTGGQAEGLGWGVQARYRFRAEDRNASGFRFGDRFEANAWATQALSPAVSLDARLAWQQEGPVEGHYNDAHAHGAPPDFQANYGGKRLELGLGANLVVLSGLRIGAEATLPVYQEVNGIQAPKRFGSALTVSRAF